MTYIPNDNPFALKAVETYRGVVYPWVIDHVGHMNVQSYVARFDEASWQFLGTLGLTPTYLKAQGTSLVALEQKTSYKLEVLEGSLLHVQTELLDVQRKTLRFIHRMYNSETGLEVAVMELVALFFDTQARRSLKFPQDVAARAKEMLVLAA